MDDSVSALAFGPDGSLYAGGGFTTAGGVAANDIARWDGAQWHPLDSGMNDSVDALAIGPDGSLYAGGWFTTAGEVAANRIARWDGAQWHPVSVFSGNGMDGSVCALALDPDGSLYAGGSFRAAGQVSASSIARWDGTQWHPLGSGRVDTICELALGLDGSLYAGGHFDIARWDGSQWDLLGSGMDDGVYALAVGPDGSLYAGGSFHAAGGVAASHIARWDGSQWHPLGSGIWGGPYAYVYTLAVGPDGSLYAGGSFDGAGGVSANNIARWDGAQWHPLGSGIGSTVSALAVSPDGSVYAGGGFTSAGGIEANGIARWDGSEWHPLGTGIGRWGVSALAVGPDGSLYAGGSFTTAGGVPANHIARWDGFLWYSLGSGMGGDTPSVRTLAIEPDGSLYAGGQFHTAGGKPSSYIAQWTGSTHPQWTWHREAEDVPHTGSMQRGTDSGGASACYYVYDTIPGSGSAITFDVTVPYNDNYSLWAWAMGLDWNQNSFWVSVDGAPFFHYEIGQFGGQWTWGWEQVHAENQPITPFWLNAGTHTIVFNSREPLARLDAVLLVNGLHYIPTQYAPCGSTATPTPTSTPTKNFDCDADAFADASHTHAYHQADTHRYFHPNDNSGTLA